MPSETFPGTNQASGNAERISKEEQAAPAVPTQEDPYKDWGEGPAEDETIYLSY